eukprot:scaffold3244_cov46-Phaeocystis_antarctica.AAC.1
MLAKMRVLFTWLAPLCILNCVGAMVVSGPAAPAPPTSPPSTDELETLRARTAKLEAVVVLHTAELESVRGECEDKIENIRQHVGMVPPSSP